MFLKNRPNGLKTSGIFLAFVIVTLLVLPSLAMAAAVPAAAPTTPCDPQFMQAIQARAWLKPSARSPRTRI